ncbi:MAG: hypothetical protein KGI89_13890, partial [Euryarchaeota archaeon]|nr:hypothetical protein [Euryarchaeota archaeon]
MPATFLFTAAAAMALLPAGAVLFVVLDRYAAPRVPKNLFDDRKVFLLVPIGIPLGIVLALVLVAYFAALSSASRSGDISGPSLYLLLFLFIAALLRRVLVRIKTFGGSSKKDPQVTIHTFAYGTMSGAGTALGFSIWQLDVPHPPLQAIPILLGFSVDLVLLEAWAGLRFGRAMCSRFS